MNKEKKGIVLVTSLLCLLPVVFSYSLYVREKEVKRR